MYLSFTWVKIHLEKGGMSVQLFKGFSLFDMSLTPRHFWSNTSLFMLRSPMNRLHCTTLITNYVKWFVSNNSEHQPNAQNASSELTRALQGLSHLIIIIPCKF